MIYAIVANVVSPARISVLKLAPAICSGYDEQTNKKISPHPLDPVCRAAGILEPSKLTCPDPPSRKMRPKVDLLTLSSMLLTNWTVLLTLFFQKVRRLPSGGRSKPPTDCISIVSLRILAVDPIPRCICRIWRSSEAASLLSLKGVERSEVILCGVKGQTMV